MGNKIESKPGCVFFPFVIACFSFVGLVGMGYCLLWIGWGRDFLKWDLFRPPLANCVLCLVFISGFLNSLGLIFSCMRMIRVGHEELKERTEIILAELASLKTTLHK